MWSILKLFSTKKDISNEVIRRNISDFKRFDDGSWVIFLPGTLAFRACSKTSQPAICFTFFRHCFAHGQNPGILSGRQVYAFLFQPYHWLIFGHWATALLIYLLFLLPNFRWQTKHLLHFIPTTLFILLSPSLPMRGLHTHLKSWW